MSGSHDSSQEDGPRHVLPIREPWWTESLDQLLASIVAKVTADRRQRRLPEVRIVIDVMDGLAPTHDMVDAIRAGLVPLVVAACDAASGPAPASDGPRLREVVITAVETSGGIEIEVADSGPGPDCLPAVALAAVRDLAEHHGGRLDVAACPEGGAAVTFSLPRRVRGLFIRPAA